ncbi:hypothetical protein KP509_20G013300 [Ceratopteris richardii]|nr:hypothetical protein KP509_20G013300 [Ceratopteris richardii]
MNLEDWLRLTTPADIYVIGFQEIVPLNAGNVLGVDDKCSAMRWLHLIQKALNKKSSPVKTATFPHKLSPKRKSHSLCSGRMDEPFTAEEYHNVDLRSSTISERGSLHKSLCGPQHISSLQSHSSNEANISTGAIGVPIHLPPPAVKSCCGGDAERTLQYALVASKQMVGILLSVWVRDDLGRYVQHVNISSVRCGVMGYLGNKGSISISLRLHQTTFCFICSHLTSGEKEGDELRRNCDVNVILKRTYFSTRLKGSLPHTILEHDHVLWIGDLNYRLALPSTSMKSLLARRDWDALLERDQLHIERTAGRVFKGWHEGKICFPPTYKYRTGSDTYAVERRKFGQKRRTPAWCDRILWYGNGLKQLEYVRAESSFSDHRPVYAVFLAEVVPKKLKDFLV